MTRALLALLVAYHLTMLEMFGTLDDVLSIGALALVALAAGALAQRPLPARVAA